MIDPNSIEKVETIYGSFTCWRDDLITEQFKRFSAHTRNELAMLSHVIRPGDNILDIGAHIGSFAIPFARFMQGKGKIFSFEANPENYQLLTENIVQNQLEQVIFPFNAVVSNKKQAFSMQVPDQGNTGTHYFLPSADSDEHYTCINIDQWHADLDNPPPIKLLKIDVEGAEISVLDACAGIIGTYLPTLYIEVAEPYLQRFGTCSEDIDHRLKGLGYHYFRNIGKRNSADDSFQVAQIEKVRDGGEFYDLLAIHPDSDRYPKP